MPAPHGHHFPPNVIPTVGRYDVVIRRKPETPPVVFVLGSFMLMLVLAAVLGTCGTLGAVAYAGKADSVKTEAAVEAPSAPAPAPAPAKKADGRKHEESSYHELR